MLKKEGKNGAGQQCWKLFVPDEHCQPGLEVGIYASIDGIVIGGECITWNELREAQEQASDYDEADCPNERLVMWALNLGFATGHADTDQDLLDEVGVQIKELQGNYYELLYGVASKFPNETRHETALRYIRNAETHCSGAAQCEPT